MIRLIAVAALLAVATSAHAMSPAPFHEPDGMITQVAYGCGAGRTRVGGVCVARTTKRQVRRCSMWGAGNVCRRVVLRRHRTGWGGRWRRSSCFQAPSMYAHAPSASAGASFSPSPTIEPFSPRLQAPRRVRPFHRASALCRSMSFSLRAINRYVGNLPPMRACFRTTRRRLYFGQRTMPRCCASNVNVTSRVSSR